MSPATVCRPGLSLCSFSRSIDTSEAKKVPGFVCFLTEEDIPHSNVTGLCNDETVFAKDKVYLYLDLSSEITRINVMDLICAHGSKFLIMHILWPSCNWSVFRVIHEGTEYAIWLFN